MKQITLLISGLIFSLFSATAQSVSLDSIFHEIDKSNPVVKMHDADIRSLNEAAKGARSWEAPELGTGFWMTPYNPALWKKNADGTTGMGQYMITVTQMIPNKKQLDANAKYMVAMSSVNEKNKQAALNELYAAAKKSYFDWLMVEKKLKVLDDNEKLLTLIKDSNKNALSLAVGKVKLRFIGFMLQTSCWVTA